MAQAGMTSELYIDADNPNSTLGAPPSAPAPVPPPVAKVEVAAPVSVKGRMADETPDGRVRDTSMEAVTSKGKDLGFRNLTDESENAPKPKPEEAAPAAEAQPAAEAPKVEANTPAVPEKVYAGKFKSAEELEKGYLEAQKAMHKAMEEKAALERQAAQPKVEVVKSPAQLAAEEAKKAEFLQQFVADPERVMNDINQRAVQQTQVALASQKMAEEWKKNNPDLTAYENYVAFESYQLTQSDPELAKDPAALLNKATENFRAITGKLRSEGAKEALTQETRVIPLLSNTATSSSEQPSSQAKAPLSSDDAFSLHLKMLKEQEQKSKRGLRR